MDEFGILTEAEIKFVQAHNENIRREERERIIALIENTEHSFWVDCRPSELIARINGGNE